MSQITQYGFEADILDSIIGVAQKNEVEKIILFGSRARGDFDERSDIDIAAFGGNTNNFLLDIDEDVNTLLDFDVVNMDKEVQPELLDSINKDGVLLYEKI